jgi:hypothetical protein
MKLKHPTVRSQFLITIFLLSFAQVSHTGIAAQEAYFWSEQERIPQYLNMTEEPPFVIADQNRTVHAFNSQPLDLGNSYSPKVIVYRRWTMESGWTLPNDILFDENGGNIDLIGAAGDQSGKVHLVFLSNGTLFYTQAFLSQASDATAWSTPISVGENARPPQIGFERVAAIAADAAGKNIVIVYSGFQEGNGLYFVGSSDGGNSWTEPYPIYLVGEDLIASDPKLYSGKSGLIHAVWGTRRQDGHYGLGYYANFSLQNYTWSEPVLLDDGGIGSPSVIEYEDDILVTYIQGDYNANLWRQSLDNGKTWSTPSRVSPQHIGSNGLISFAVDSNNTLHAFFGQRINDENHGMWHTVWTGYGWTTPDAVVRGPKVRDVIGGNGFDPESARAVIVNGDIALVTWATDGSSGTNGAWYSFEKLNTPELPIQLLPIPSSAPEHILLTVTPSSTEITAPTVVTNKIPQNLLNTPRTLQNPQTSIFVGVIPVLLLIALFFFWYTRYSRLK